MERPLVTVVIPVYNRESTIFRAVNSVLRQTYTNIEIIIVDDCSTDSTLNVIKDCNDDRIRLICLSHNYGANYARNRGIEQAEGEFIAFQDSDDEWMEDKLDRQIRYMIEEDFQASFCPYILCDGENRQVMPCDYKNSIFYKSEMIERLKAGNIVGTPTLVVKRNVFSQIGMFDERMDRLQDYEFVIRFVKKFRLGYIDKPLVKAYKMEKSISADKKALLDAYKILVEKHFDFIDFRYMVDTVFNYTDIFLGGEIDWKEFDGLLDRVRNKRDIGEKTDYYKQITECVYKKYFPAVKLFEEWYNLFSEFLKTEEFAIYGAGTYGRKAFYDLKKQNCIPKYFLVTRQEENCGAYGVPVVELSDHKNTNMPVLIAVSWEKQKELIKNLLDKGIYRFCIYPFCQ